MKIIALAVVNALMTVMNLFFYWLLAHVVFGVPTDTDTFIVGLVIVGFCHNSKIED